MFKNIYLTFFSVLSIISLSANANAEVKCVHTLYGNSYNNELPMDTTTYFIRQDTLLTPKGILECKINSNYSTKSNKKSKIESGSINNVMYRVYYSDGSGSVQGLKTNTLDYAKDESGTNWFTHCTKDEMDDSRWCGLDKGDLSVMIWKDGTALVHIGHEHYPGSNVTIRIDKGKPITASEKLSFTRAQSDDIINALKSGKSALTRHQNWPYKKNIDTHIDLYGFTEAWSILNSIFKASVPN